jgi:hypothetical protein
VVNFINNYFKDASEQFYYNSNLYDEKIVNPFGLLGEIVRGNVGDTALIKYLRNNNTSSVNVQLELRPDSLNLNSV